MIGQTATNECHGVPGQFTPVPWCKCPTCEAKRRLLPEIAEMLERSGDMTLATLREDGFPQASPVSFANDGMHIYFGTETNSRKTRNMALCDKVSLSLVPPYRRREDMRGVSIRGHVTKITDFEEMIWATGLLRERHHGMAALLPDDPEGLDMYRVDPLTISYLSFDENETHCETIEAGEETFVD